MTEEVKGDINSIIFFDKNIKWFNKEYNIWVKIKKLKFNYTYLKYYLKNEEKKFKKEKKLPIF